jgi:nickel-dependent lactate racemase
MLGINIRNKYNIINHDAFNEKDLELAGKTSNNIPIWLNKKWINNDIKITTGFVEPHFFAGFSGGPKMVAPGLAGFKTIMGLHSSKMISNPNSTWGITFGNPIHDSIREIAKINKVDFSIDVSINRDHQITSIYAGELFTIHKACSDFVKHISMKPLSKRFPIILTSNSGYPLDLNLYQAVKGISAAAQVVEEKGSILCVAECKDGIPSHGKFKQILESRDTPEGLLEMINSDKYESHDQWQVQILAQIMTKANISFMSENIKDQDIISSHMSPITNLEKTLDEKIKEYGKGSEILVLPQGPQTIPYIYN